MAGERLARQAQRAHVERLPHRVVQPAVARERAHQTAAARVEVAVRDGDWKLLVNADGTGAELYDVVADRAETKNRVGDKPEVAKRLTEAALAWRKALP